MQLTKNFSLEEFRCKDGTPVPQMYLKNITELAINLQVLRDNIGLPIIINSGYRTVSYNNKIGGVVNSQHIYGKAADIRVPGMDAKNLYNIIKELIAENKIHNGGLGLYWAFVHYDIRSFPARWNFR